MLHCYIRIIKIIEIGILHIIQITIIFSLEVRLFSYIQFIFIINLSRYYVTLGTKPKILSILSRGTLVLAR